MLSPSNWEFHDEILFCPTLSILASLWFGKQPWQNYFLPMHNRYPSVAFWSSKIQLLSIQCDSWGGNVLITAPGGKWMFFMVLGAAIHVYQDYSDCSLEPFGALASKQVFLPPPLSSMEGQWLCEHALTFPLHALMSTVTAQQLQKEPSPCGFFFFFASVSSWFYCFCYFNQE